MKRVLVIVQESPFNTLRTSEAFRMTMGLILSENEVSILLMGDGVLSLLPLKAEAIGQPSIETYLEYFPRVRVQLYAEAEALANRGIETVPDGTKRLSHPEAITLISEAEVVIPFR